LDKLRLRHKRRRRVEARVRRLRHREIPQRRRSSPLRRDSNLRRPCRRDSNRHHRRRENLVLQDNLQQPVNLERPGQ
jgi:hypothetical protein